MRLAVRSFMLLSLGLGVLGCDDIMASDPGCRVVAAETAITEHHRYMATCTFQKEKDVKFILFCGQDDALRRTYEVTLSQLDGGAAQTLYLTPHRDRNLNGTRLIERTGRDFVPFELEGEYRLSMRTTRGCADKEGKALPACTLALNQIRLCERPEDCVCDPLPPAASGSAAPSAAAPPAPAPAPAPSAAPSSAAPEVAAEPKPSAP